MNRLFVSESDIFAQQVSLNLDQQRHLLKVCRLSVGDSLTLITDVQLYVVEVIRIQEAQLFFKCLSSRPLSDSQIRYTLIQALPKQDKFSEICNYCTQAGVSRVYPLSTQRCDVKLTEAVMQKKKKRWSSVLLSASLQSQSEQVTQLGDPLGLEALSTVFGHEQALKVVFWEEASSSQTLAALIKKEVPFLKEQVSFSVHFMVGPEGGLTADEVSFCRSQGYQVASLGSSVLRVESAAFYALAQFKALFDVFL